MIHQAEARLVAIVSSCGVNKRNSNWRRASYVDSGITMIEFMMSKPTLLFFFSGTFVNVGQVFSLILALLDTSLGEEDVILHAEGPLKMEGKDEYTQNSPSSCNYKPQGFLQ